MKVKRDTKDSEGRRCLLVKNLSLKITELDLLNTFEQFGVVTKTFIPKKKETNESRGFGYITFEEASEAQNAHQMVRVCKKILLIFFFFQMHRQKLGGRPILVVYSKNQTFDEK